MNFLKRATPWMVSLTILLLSYGASYYWLYKPRYGHNRAVLKGPVHLVFLPIVHLDVAYMRQKRQREARDFCQGNWQGHATVLSIVENRLLEITYQVTIDGDTLTIISANHDTVLVGKTWQIESFDDYKMLFQPIDSQQSSSVFQVFSSPAFQSSPDALYIPQFLFHHSPNHSESVISFSDKSAYLKRMTP